MLEKDRSSHSVLQWEECEQTLPYSPFSCVISRTFIYGRKAYVWLHSL